PYPTRTTAREWQAPPRRPNPGPPPCQCRVASRMRALLAVVYWFHQYSVQLPRVPPTNKCFCQDYTAAGHIGPKLVLIVSPFGFFRSKCSAAFVTLTLV